MRQLLDWRHSTLMAGVDWRRWLFGFSFERPREDLRVLVLRFGPLFLHAMRHEARR